MARPATMRTLSSDISRHRTGLAAALAVCLACLAPQPVQSAGQPPITEVHEDEPAGAYPRVKIEIPVEIETDWTFSSDDPDADLIDLFPTIEPYFTFFLTPSVRVETGFVLEPVLDPTGDRFFGDVGLYLETAMLVFEHRGFDVYAGKFTPEFGIAWDKAPGIYGTDAAEAYELTERLGGGIGFTYDAGAMGSHRLTAAVFFMDNTALSESLFTNRGRTTTALGGPSNTGDLSSFAISATGENAFGVAGLVYHAGFVYQDSSLVGETAEKGYVFGLAFEREIGAFSLAPLAECAFFDDAGAVPGASSYICTGGFEAGYNGYSLAAVATRTHLEVPGAAASDVDYGQLSAGYQFANGAGVALGYKIEDADAVVSHTLGLLLTYDFERRIAAK